MATPQSDNSTASTNQPPPSVLYTAPDPGGNIYSASFTHNYGLGSTAFTIQSRPFIQYTTAPNPFGHLHPAPSMTPIISQFYTLNFQSNGTMALPDQVEYHEAQTMRPSDHGTPPVGIGGLAQQHPAEFRNVTPPSMTVGSAIPEAQGVYVSTPPNHRAMIRNPICIPPNELPPQAGDNAYFNIQLIVACDDNRSISRSTMPLFVLKFPIKMPVPLEEKGEQPVAALRRFISDRGTISRLISEVQRLFEPHILHGLAKLMEQGGPKANPLALGVDNAPSLLMCAQCNVRRARTFAHEAIFQIEPTAVDEFCSGFFNDEIPTIWNLVVPACFPSTRCPRISPQKMNTTAAPAKFAGRSCGKVSIISSCAIPWGCSPKKSTGSTASYKKQGHGPSKQRHGPSKQSHGNTS
ncbi:hypothetical protein MBM_02982 [Drepanopeziza brunnea f. sp. 'multigermtubi' MB_m1]|uniref:Uncharacterized protein n=1 Tax=Marssonina brunnea f. sp. multigermtubi (strain MB_m1) TaxID=1072389 RepID=K1WM13_MARBU|nr:uncharacterized protein MBM_02982 [Drepanopeziza brunnea f. sp. 'multigermtubi' MB_m1]EKD18740.1 hypothetical protein MBM_02982 [Drepanopeziza brunnea f. sp. 'multigermtubi' MB_m1]